MPAELGLPSDVLKVIPFDGNYLAGDTPGNMPRTLAQAFLDFWVTLGTWIWQALVALAGLFLAFVGFLIQIGMAILGAIAEAAIALIEFAVKAAILVYVYILFAIDFLEKTLFYILIGITLLISVLLFGGTMEFNLFTPFRLKASLFGFDIEQEEWYEWEINNFLDVSLPIVYTKSILNGQLLTHSKRDFLLGTSETLSSVIQTSEEEQNLLSNSESDNRSGSSSLITRQNGFPTKCPPPDIKTISLDTVDISTVKIDWDPVLGAESYKIYRAEHPFSVIDNTVTQLAIGYSSTHYEDVVDKSGTYYYALVTSGAVGDSLLSENSQPISISTIPSITRGGAVVNWDKSISYNILILKSVNDNLGSEQLEVNIKDPQGSVDPEYLSIDDNQDGVPSGWIRWKTTVNPTKSGVYQYNFYLKTPATYYPANGPYHPGDYKSLDKPVFILDKAQTYILLGIEIASIVAFGILAEAVSYINEPYRTVLSVIGLAALWAPLIISIVPLFTTGDNYRFQWCWFATTDRHTFGWTMIVFSIVMLIFSLAVATNQFSMIEKFDKSQPILSGIIFVLTPMILSIFGAVATAPIIAEIITLIAVGFGLWKVIFQAYKYLPAKAGLFRQYHWIVFITYCVVLFSIFIDAARFPYNYLLFQ